MTRPRDNWSDPHRQTSSTHRTQKMLPIWQLMPCQTQPQSSKVKVAAGSSRCNTCRHQRTICALKITDESVGDSKMFVPLLDYVQQQQDHARPNTSNHNCLGSGRRRIRLEGILGKRNVLFDYVMETVLLGLLQPADCTIQI